MLLRKSLRDLRAMGARAVLMVLVVGAGAGTAAGILLALDDVKQTRNDFYARYALADLDVGLLRPLAPKPLLDRARAAGASATSTRLILGGQALLGPRGGAAAELIGMRPGAPLDRLAVVDGSGLHGAGARDAVLEADFARRHAIVPGDRITLRALGRRIELGVRGLVRSPEYLLASANPDYLIPQKGSLAVVFLPLRRLQRLAGAGRRVNDLAADLPGGGEGASAQRLVRGLPAARVTPRAEQYSLRFTDADIRSFSIFAPVMGAVFALVGLLLIALSLRRLVSSQRRELGAMLALGYPTRAVVATVLVPAFILAVAGAALAMIVTVAVGRLVAVEYAGTVGFPSTSHSLSAGPLALAAALAIASTMLAALVPAYRLGRLEPVQAMRGEAVGSFAIPGWLQRTTATAPLPVVYAVRAMLRRPLLTAATVLSIGAAIGLAASLNILISSTDRAVAREFDSQAWTDSADLSSPEPTRLALHSALRSGARRSEAIVKGPAELRGPAGDVPARLVGLPGNSPLLTLDLSSGGSPAPGRAVLAEQTARRAQATVGDRLELRTPAGAERIRVVGLARTLAGEEVYLPRRQASSLLGVPGEATTVLVEGSRAAAARLRKQPGVSRVISKDAAKKGGRDLVRELTGLVAVLEAISLGVGALFLVSTLALSYLDRRGEFATLLAMGYGRRQLTAIFAEEALAQTAAAAALAIPLGLLIASPLSKRIAQAWFEIGLHPQAPNYIVVIVPALVLALLAAAQAARRALGINIAASVRARLIG
jgi:putative ABC transport system permease protein